MKRKTKTALKLICQVVDRLKPSTEGGDSKALASPDYIYNLVFLYRAYGYFVTEDYDNSLKDYIKANQVKKLNHTSTYNMVLCQGLKCLASTEYENAISFFTKSSQKLPNNRDPYLLRAIAIVRYAMHKPIKQKTKTKMLKDAKRDLNKALQNSQKDYNVLYLRGLVNFALHFFYDAITDLETVIEKSEEASAKHYLARGRCYACLSMFKEAITDLSIAINLNKDLLDAYLNRGKCAYLIGDTGLAFMDFQKLIVIEPKNPMVHIYAGNLLMTTGSYEDATKAFTNADNIYKSSLALY
jgi:tetratricopeptide (TPR) repeat protein